MNLSKDKNHRGEKNSPRPTHSACGRFQLLCIGVFANLLRFFVIIKK